VPERVGGINRSVKHDWAGSPRRSASIGTKAHVNRQKSIPALRMEFLDQV